jgi:DNA-binding transcriptional ArsR family regulator
MVLRSEALDHLFMALADPTRRAVLERLGRGPASVTELATPFDMALPSFVRHLQVLEEAALVRSRKQGRVRTFWIVPDQMALAENWLARQHRLWERRLNQLDRFAATLKQKEDEG